MVGIRESFKHPKIHKNGNTYANGACGAANFVLAKAYDVTTINDIRIARLQLIRCRHYMGCSSEIGIPGLRHHFRKGFQLVFNQDEGSYDVHGLVLDYNPGRNVFSIGSQLRDVIERQIEHREIEFYCKIFGQRFDGVLPDAIELPSDPMDIVHPVFGFKDAPNPAVDTPRFHHEPLRLLKVD